MAVVEVQPHGVDADRLDLRDPDVLLGELELALAAAVAAHLGRRRVDAQVLEGQGVPRAVRPLDLDDAGLST